MYSRKLGGRFMEETPFDFEFDDDGDDEFEGFADEAEMLAALLESKTKEITAFKDPILQYQYEQLLGNEEELLSLDALIAASKVRFGVAVRQGNHMEVAQLLRSITDGIEKAIAVREKHREYIHLEQVLWLLQEVNQMNNDVVSDQEEVHELSRRLSRLVMIPREDIPLEIRKTARALAEGRKLTQKDK
jgi:hypothetical protein